MPADRSPEPKTFRYGTTVLFPVPGEYRIVSREPLDQLTCRKITSVLPGEWECYLLEDLGTMLLSYLRPAS